MQNAQVSTTSALPPLVAGCGSDEFRWTTLQPGALRTFLVAADPLGTAAWNDAHRPALPHIVINALDPLFCLLPSSSSVLSCASPRRSSASDTRGRRRRRRRHLREADDRAHAEWNGSQHADHDRNDAGRTAWPIRCAKTRAPAARHAPRSGAHRRRQADLHRTRRT